MNLSTGNLERPETSISDMPQGSCMPFQTIWLHTYQLTSKFYFISFMKEKKGLIVNWPNYYYTL